MELLTQRYSEKISGTLSCYDRIVITGTLPVLSNAGHLTAYLFQNNVRIFDYAKFAEPYRDELKQNAQCIAEEAGLKIEYIRSRGVRKEAVIESIIKKRGTHPGLVHSISVMEACTSYKPWPDKITHKTFLKYDQGKCLTYYFYFIDELLGLCYVRVLSPHLSRLVSSSKTRQVRRDQSHTQRKTGKHRYFFGQENAWEI